MHGIDISEHGINIPKLYMFCPIDKIRMPIQIMVYNID